jgi:hypothetical protein
VSAEPITRERVAAEAQRLLREFEHRITVEQALLLAGAALDGAPLDPYDFDDAAVLLRAERLFLDGLTVAQALATARAESATFAERVR